MASQIVKVAQLSIKLGGEHLDDYGSYKSRHDFTQKQLLACLILRIHLKTTYRGLIDILEGHTDLRKALGMQHKLPHYTTLQKFSSRSEVLQIVDVIIGKLGNKALKAQDHQGELAMDSTGMESSVASAHFVSRAGRKRKKFLKLSVSVVCGALLPVGMVLDWGPNNDKCQALDLLHKSFSATEENLPSKLLADAGYDADWVHGVCREVWGVKSIIKPVVHREDGSLGGLYRSKMTSRKLKKEGYSRRWHVETYFSALKRRYESSLRARAERNQLKEAALKVLTYAIHR